MGGSFDQRRPPCSVPAESPIVAVVSSTDRSLEASAVMLGGICTIGKVSRVGCMCGLRDADPTRNSAQAMALTP